MKPKYVIPLIIVAVFLWGVFHAVGAYRFNHNPLRFWAVLGTDCAFLAFWVALLAVRRGRTKHDGHARHWKPPEA